MESSVCEEFRPELRQVTWRTISRRFYDARSALHSNDKLKALEMEPDIEFQEFSRSIRVSFLPLLFFSSPGVCVKRLK